MISMVKMSGRWTVLPAVVALAVLTVGCGVFGLGRPEPVVLVATPTPGVVVYGQEEGSVKPVELTRTADERRRMRDDHARLIDRMPGTATPVPTPDADDLEKVAVARVVEAFSDRGYESEAHADWFDPERGLYFFREGRGDWSTSRLRKVNPYSALFYYEEYPHELANFAEGSMQRELAVMLAFEAASLMPVLGSPTPAMVDLIEDKLGWAIRASDGPVINVWSEFDLVSRGVARQRFAVGGVMELGVGRRGRGDEWYEYLEVGRWIGPVVVERLQ